MQEYFAANQKLWNERVEYHLRSDFYRLQDFEKGWNALNETELTELGDVNGKTLLHLQCHFGMDTISWARLGAQVTGLDFSEKAIEQAQLLAQKHAPDAKFVCCNVYDCDDYIQEKFDIVFTSYGTIGWLPDLVKWAKVVANRLKPNGVFYIVDFHPVLWCLDDNYETIHYPYFNTQVIETESHGTYADNDAPLANKEYGWNHPFSEILGALLKEGLQLEVFNEFDFSHYECFSQMEKIEEGKYVFKKFGKKLPYMYSLKMKKIQ